MERIGGIGKMRGMGRMEKIGKLGYLILRLVKKSKNKKI